MIDAQIKTRDGTKKIKAYTWEECKLPVISFKGLQRNHKIVKYGADFMTLDTETSHKDLVTAWIYQWAIKFKDLYVYGRKPSELIEFMTKAAEHYSLNDNKKLLIYIHNAAYDVQYLKHFFKKYDANMKILSTDAHAVLIVDVLGFRILCSYRLTNLSLNALSTNYAEKYIKAVGEIDYNVIRFQDSDLNDEDWFYMFSDVASQYDGITQYLKMMGYKYAYEAPFTSTGFVRTKCRKASRKDKKWRDTFMKTALDIDMYNLCRWAFMGGVCIASFIYTNQTIRSDKLKHKDFTSSYPARQIMSKTINYFPIGAPSWYGDIDSAEELEDILNNYCCVFELTLYDVHIKKGVTAPCIPSSKCHELVEPVRVNGKIVYAKHLTIAVTELDYKWIKRQYKAENMSVSNMLIFERGALPDWLTDEVFEYFTNKCTLSGVNDTLYRASKALLNAIYGMTATSPIRPEYELNDALYFEPKAFKDPEEHAKKTLQKYYNSYNSFMPYQFALYTTAWSRDALYTMIEATGDSDGHGDNLTDVYKNFLYCDTDSVFYLETKANKIRMSAYQDKCKQDAIDAGAFVGEKYLGLPTDEPPLRAFRALHAKCYAMEEYSKKSGQYELNVVIAGIPKKSIKWIDGKPVEKTNAEELETIDNLQNGFTFKHCGGTRCVYNEREIEIMNIDGHITELSSSAVIDNIEKVISENMWTVENTHILKMAQKSL